LGAARRCPRARSADAPAVRRLLAATVSDAGPADRSPAARGGARAMSRFESLPTLAEVQARPRAEPKGLPRVLAKEKKRKTKEDKDKAFRAAVWARDGGK